MLWNKKKPADEFLFPSQINGMGPKKEKKDMTVSEKKGGQMMIKNNSLLRGAFFIWENEHPGILFGRP